MDTSILVEIQRWRQRHIFGDTTQLMTNPHLPINCWTMLDTIKTQQ